MSAILNSQRYTMHEAARLLNVHVATVWRWHLDGVRHRKLRTILIGARRYVLADDLEAFVAHGNEPRDTDDAALHRRADAAGELLDAQGVKSHPTPEH